MTRGTFDIIMYSKKVPNMYTSGEAQHSAYIAQWSQYFLCTHYCLLT